MFNFINRVLNIDLTGKFESTIKYYLNSRFHFDSKVVDCTVLESKYSASSPYFTFSASSRCNDVYKTSTDERLTFYESNKFETYLEADNHLEIEIEKASKVFTRTRFFKKRYYPEHGLCGKQQLCCLNGKWSQEENNNNFRCAACGAEFKDEPIDKICSRCGEFL